MRRVAAGWMLAWGLLVACGGGEAQSEGSGATDAAGSGAAGTSQGSGAAGTSQGSGAAGTGAGSTGGNANASGTGTASTGTSSGGSSGAGGSGGAMPAPAPICLQACNTPSDCASASPAFDADNYACTGGACIYQGCNSDTECAATGLVCRQQYGLDICVYPCSVSADCDIGGGPAYDANNYQCVMGGCFYQGCNNNAECAASPGGTDVCWDNGSGVKVCALSCNVPADCVAPNAQAPYDVDNYACDSGVCRYTGCNSNAECAALGNFICATP